MLRRIGFECRLRVRCIHRSGVNSWPWRRSVERRSRERQCEIGWEGIGWYSWGVARDDPRERVRQSDELLAEGLTSTQIWQWVVCKRGTKEETRGIEESQRNVRNRFSEHWLEKCESNGTVPNDGVEHIHACINASIHMMISSKVAIYTEIYWEWYVKIYFCTASIRMRKITGKKVEWSRESNRSMYILQMVVHRSLFWVSPPADKMKMILMMMIIIIINDRWWGAIHENHNDDNNYQDDSMGYLWWLYRVGHGFGVDFESESETEHDFTDVSDIVTGVRKRYENEQNGNERNGVDLWLALRNRIDRTLMRW